MWNWKSEGTASESARIEASNAASAAASAASAVSSRR
jgi:hypothetical protein